MSGSANTTRRGVIALVSALAGAAVQGGSASARAARPPAPAREPTPQDAEGPYYFDAKLVRSDISEGRAGLPLEIRLSVLEQNGRPATGARVDIWHCDSQGVYSGFSETGGSLPNQTFLRGAQVVDGAGQVVFRTIYPGWYQGRTAHVHFKVFLGARCPLTSQMYLPDTMNEYIYTAAPDYRRPVLRDTLNANDMFKPKAGDVAEATLKETVNGFFAEHTLVIDSALNLPGAKPPPWMKPPFPATQPLLTGEQRIGALLPGRRAGGGRPA